MATKSDTVEVVIDNNKDTLMEVRGIIDGVLDSGSTDYKTALEQIVVTIGNHGIVLPPVV